MTLEYFIDNSWVSGDGNIRYNVYSADDDGYGDEFDEDPDFTLETNLKAHVILSEKILNANVVAIQPQAENIIGVVVQIGGSK